MQFLDMEYGCLKQQSEYKLYSIIMWFLWRSTLRSNPKDLLLNYLLNFTWNLKQPRTLMKTNPRDLWKYLWGYLYNNFNRLLVKNSGFFLAQIPEGFAWKTTWETNHWIFKKKSNTNLNQSKFYCGIPIVKKKHRILL